MAKRVRRVKRKTRKRVKSLKKQGTQGITPGDGRNFTAIGDMDGDGPGDRTASKKKLRAKRRASASGDVDAVDAIDGGSEVATENAVTRKEGGFSDRRGEDGFERGREAYEAYVRGNVEKDAERFDELRAGGAIDDFDPEIAPSDAERLGTFKSAAHLVRMYDHWTLNNFSRLESIEQAALWLGGFNRADNVRKVLGELESKPIRDIYPLEVMMELLDKNPAKLPGVEPGSVIGGFPALTDGKVTAGHSIQIPVPDGVRLKAFALLGGERPGYEFHPSKKDGFYTLLVDTPGEYDFALYAVRTQKLGRMSKELPGGVVERFKVNVSEMTRKATVRR
jgi:hypothetical protein